MPMLELASGAKEKPLVLMTHPNKQPCNVPATLVGDYLTRGYKRGYTEPPEVTKRRAASKVDLVSANEQLRKEIAELKKPQKTKK